MTEAKNGRCELTNVLFQQGDYSTDELYFIAHGNVVSDPKGRFYIGDRIRTSVVQEINLKEGWFVTLNTKYYIV